MIQRNSKLCDFPVHSVCFLHKFFFRSEQKCLPVLYHCTKFYKFSPSNFRYFRSKYKFCKIFEGTRSLNLHLCEPSVLVRARAISGPGRARQETISSHLNSCVESHFWYSIERSSFCTRKYVWVFYSNG